MRKSISLIQVLTLAGLLLAPATRAQIAADPVTVSVQFQGLYTPASGGSPAVTINFDPNRYATSVGAPAGQTTNAVASLRPGKNYTFSIHPTQIQRIQVKLTPVAGYRVFINGVEHEMFDWNPPNNSPGYFSVRIDDGSGAPVGEAGSLRPGRVLWSVGLGNLKNGKPAGSLMIAENGLTAATFSPQALFYTRDIGLARGIADEGEVEVIKSGGLLRQVYATAVLADVTAANDHGYFIRLYPRDSGQIGAPDPVTGVYPVSGDPLFEFKVENPAHPALDALRITRTVRQNGILTTWTEMRKQPGQPAGTTQWLVHDWVKKPADAGEAGPVASPVRHRWTYANGDRDELMEMVDGVTGAVARRVFRRYVDLNFGFETSRELEYEETGSIDPIRTAYSYHQSVAAADLGAWHRIRQVSSTDGSWTAYEYENDYWARGRIRQIRRPYKDAPMVDPGSASTSGDVTNFTYFGLDAFGTKYLHSVTRTINGSPAGRTEFTYADETVIDASSIYPLGNSAMPVTVVTRKDFHGPGAGDFLTTITRTYREDADPEYRFFTGLPHSVIKPDGTATATAYFRGDFQAADPFHQSTTGGARVQVTLKGTTDGSTGTIMNSYSGAQALLNNFRVVSGKSAKSLTLMDANGLPRVTQQEVYLSGAWSAVQQDWFNYVNSIWPSLVQRRTSTTGAFWNESENVWASGRLTSGTDATGIRKTFDYDDVGRVKTITREGATYDDAVIAAQSVEHTYDAAGAVLKQVVSGAGFAETITTHSTYDDAGRVRSETQPLVAPVTYQYDVTHRRTTVNLPSSASAPVYRREQRYIDGQLALVDGNAVVAESHDFDRDGSDLRTTMKLGGGTVRFRQVSVDWLGRTKKTFKPRFSGAPADFVETFNYDAVKGRLTSMQRTGYAPQLYSYDAMSEVTRSGMDVERGGGQDGLFDASTDRISESDTVFENYSGAIWLKTSQWGYPYSSTPPPGHTYGERKLMSVMRRRVTGLSASLRSETRTWDADNVMTQRIVTVDPVNKLVRSFTAQDGLTTTAEQRQLNGQIISSRGFDGVTLVRAYDPLGRVRQESDPRTGGTTTTYFRDSSIVKQVTDGAGRLLHYVVSLDEAGRPSVLARELQATGPAKLIRRSHNARGQIEKEWGSGVQPVRYSYDPDYAERTKMWTYQDPAGVIAWNSDQWPGDPATFGETKWEYDGPTGLLKRKYDAAGQFVEYTYNERGQTASRRWARKLLSATSTPLTTLYTYDPDTGELTDVGYNDGGAGEMVQTPPIKYAYTRLGQLWKVWDGTNAGTPGNAADFREFIFEPEQPSRLAALDLPSFYNEGASSRVMTRRYDGIFRSTGFTLGITGNLAANLVQGLSYATNGRLHTVDTSRANNAGTTRRYTYGYVPDSALVQSLASGAFSVIRGYEEQRDLLKSIEARWDPTGSSPVIKTRFDYSHSDLGQRQTARQTGDAYVDGSATGMLNAYRYNDRGELETAAAYRGSVSVFPPPSADELPGRRFEYRYDRAGNRRTAGATGNAGLGDNEYQVNSLNQYYPSKENNAVRVLGTADMNAAVAAQSTGATEALVRVTRKDRSFAADILADNASGPRQGILAVYAAPSGGANVAAKLERNWFAPPQTQQLRYDLDGNLVSDDVWNYHYDAENRLVRMISSLPVGFGNRLQLTFKYDYLGRRVEKRVVDLATGTEVSSRRYLYDGWDLVAEFNAPGGTSCGTLVRSYTWGLDIASSLGATGGVGALIQITDHGEGKTFLPTYDGNGNLASLINATDGTLAAAYEYGPFGEALRAQVLDPVVSDQPFRFSTKFFDVETSLTYYGARFYSADLGRFINRDPIAEQGGLNLYGFCGNDGINRYDYLGQKSFFSKIWNKFRHTIISSVLYAIPGAGPALGTFYNAAVGARYGGAQGLLLSLASGGRLGGPLQVAGNLYGLYRSFAHGKFLNNFGNWYLNRMIANGAYQLGDRIFNAPPTGPSQIDAGDEPAVDRSELGEEIGPGFKTRQDMEAFAFKPKELDRYDSSFFTARWDGTLWRLYKSGGIYTNLVYVNGILGTLGRHASLALAHLSARFSDYKQFTIAHNRSHGFFMDILETGGDLLGIPSKSSTLLAGALEQALGSGRQVTIVAHSQGFATTLKAMRILALKGVEANGLTVYPHAGAANSFLAGEAANGIGASLQRHVFSSFDLVPGIVGMNANPVQALGGLIGFPSLLGDETKSAHSVINARITMPWLGWGPGN